MRAAYLTCHDVLPGAPNRRVDAFEHDQMMAALGPAFAAAGDSVEARLWDEDGADWSAYDAVVVGTVWDYQDRGDAFFAAVERIADAAPVFNPPATLRWNARKTYLRELAVKGVPVIPTVWLDRPDTGNVAAAFDTLVTDDIVAKRQVGANADGQHRLRRGEPAPEMAQPMMLQPFLPSVQAEGEYSAVVLGGSLSHALLKQPQAGDYRVQSSYGGHEAPVQLSDDIRAEVDAVMAALDKEPLYARVDMVRGPDGGMLLMELELIEPFLYPLQGEDFGANFHAALARRLAA